MPSGFAGRSAERFFETSNEAVLNASISHTQDPFRRLTERLVPFPELPQLPNQRFPFSVQSTRGGSHSVGVGRSTNLVVDPAIYGGALQRASQVDDQTGADLFRAVTMIEEMCESIFVVPETITRMTALSDEVKSCLRQFRPVAEEINVKARRYVDAIMEADRVGSPAQASVVAASESGTEQALRGVSGAMDQQSSNMDRTNVYFSAQAVRLAERAERERAREAAAAAAAAGKNKII